MKKLFFRYFTLIVFLLAIIAGCSSSNKDDFKGFDTSFIDTTVTPQQDFYQYAIGNWLKNNPVPEDQSIWAAFTVLREQTQEQVQGIILDAAKTKVDDAASLQYKIGTFYSVGMDSTKIDSLGWEPIKPELEKIDQIADKTELIKHIAYLHKYAANPLFFLYSAVDAKNSDSVVAGIWQGGLGLPDRDYYLNEDDRSKDIRAKYVEHIQNMFKLIGTDEATAKTDAEKLMKLETELASASNTRLENRNPNATYNKFSTAEIVKNYPGFDWMLYFTEIEAGDPVKVNINQPKFIGKVQELIGSTSLEDWKLYLKWSLLRSMDDYLSSDFVNESFAFNGKFLSGQPVIQPRWKRVLNATSGALGEAVGQLYVAKFFPPEAKDRAKKIVESLLVSMRESIQNLEWMSEETKKQALVKLDGFGVKIGYPDQWLDYTPLEVKNDSYVENVMRSNYFDHKEMISKINTAVRPWEWNMTPQTVNAYYSPTRNEIVFPAAILQFPFYDFRADDAINYGAMGAVIGHEVTHGFDDQGRQYDEKGNIRDWWTEQDAAQFTERANVLVEQFNEYVAVNDMHIDGAMTLGENIGDLGGLTIAYNAFTKTDQFKKGEAIDGFTPAQRFFLSWAQVWKNNIRDEELMKRIKTDVHSPGKWRVLGPFSNMPEFFAAFDVKPGDAMRRPDDKLVKIW